MSTAFHPQTDGQTERSNRILEDMLRHFVGPYHDDWDKHLPLAEFAVNNAWQESVRATPFMLNSGQDPLTPLNFGTTDSNSPAATTIVQRMDRLIRQARDALRVAQQRHKKYADRKRRDVNFSVGTQVLLSTRNLHLKHPGSAKLLPKYIGPFPVIEKIGKVAYRLKLTPELQRLHDVFHVSVLRLYHSDGRVQPPP